MIPARPAPPPPRSRESISDKISRLRREQHAASRPRLDHAPPQASSSAQRWLAASTDDSAPSRRPQRNSDPRRGTAGPAPPPSWTSPSSTSDDLSPSSTSLSSHDPRRRTPLRPRDLVERRKLAQPLVVSPGPSTTPPLPAIDSLFAVAGGVLASDLSRARTAPAQGPTSLLLEHVAYLPNHVRVRLVNEVFAHWRNPAPLTDEGARELLRTDVSDGVEVDGEDDGEGESVEADLGRLGLGDDEEGGGWEDDALAAQDAHLVELVDALDLSFAHVSLRTLRSLLLRPVGPAPPPPPPSAPSQSRPPLAAPAPAPAPPPKLVSAFAHLHTLTLTATPRVALADPLFDLVAHLVSLRHLSLAGKALDAHVSSSSTSTSTSATAASLLPRLAAATPNLRTLDLSYVRGLVVDAPCPHALVAAVRGVDWDARWGELRVLGVRGAAEERVGEGEGDEGEERERVRRDVREAVMCGRQRRKRRWIDVVV